MKTSHATILIILLGTLLCAAATPLPAGLEWYDSMPSHLMLGACYALSLAAFSVLYFIPLNAWLAGKPGPSLKLFPFSLGISFLGWAAFQALTKLTADTPHSGWVIGGVTAIGYVGFFIASRQKRVHETLPQGRLGGFFLFSPLVLFMVVLSAPISAAILVHLVGPLVKH